MKRFALAAAVLAVLAGCRTLRPERAAGPLVGEGELYLYVQPFPADAARLSFALASLEAVASDGARHPLRLALSDLSGRATVQQRLLARGRLPPGSYAGFRVGVKSATLTTDEGRSDLLVGEPHPIDAPFTIADGRATVRWLDLVPARAVDRAMSFAPAFAVIDPQLPSPQELGFVLGPEDHTVAVFDRTRRVVVAMLATGRDPGGLALDVRAGLLYVSLSGEDQIQVVDVVAGEERRRIRVAPGDAPRELALSPDGRTLLYASARAAALVFVEPENGFEVARLRVAEDPGRIQLDRTGRRAWVLGARPPSVTLVDLATRAVVTTAAVDAPPLQVQLNRAGTRLYVVSDASPYLSVLSVPEMQPAGRAFVGAGAQVVRVDPRTDLIYVGRRGDERLQLLDPFSFVAVGTLSLPDAPGDLAIDDTWNTLLAVLPARGSVAFVDLASRETVSMLDTGETPSRLVLTGERR